MNNLRLPVLVYISKKGCSACNGFTDEWKSIVYRLGGIARCVRFVCENDSKVPPCIRGYTYWYPTVILIGPKTYFKCFTVDDMVNKMDYKDNYIMRGIVYNVVMDKDKAEFGGFPYTSDAIISWFYRAVDILVDESSSPIKYQGKFS